jgi:hypothetical protein
MIHSVFHDNPHFLTRDPAITGLAGAGRQLRAESQVGDAQSSRLRGHIPHRYAMPVHVSRREDRRSANQSGSDDGMPAIDHLLENLADAPLELILVEIKR